MMFFVSPIFERIVQQNMCQEHARHKVYQLHSETHHILHRPMVFSHLGGEKLIDESPFFVGLLLGNP